MFYQADPGHDSAYKALPRTGFDRGLLHGFEVGSLAEQAALLQFSGVLALISERKS